MQTLRYPADRQLPFTSMQESMWVPFQRVKAVFWIISEALGS